MDDKEKNVRSSKKKTILLLIVILFFSLMAHIFLREVPLYESYVSSDSNIEGCKITIDGAIHEHKKWDWLSKRTKISKAELAKLMDLASNIDDGRIFLPNKCIMGTTSYTRTGRVNILNKSIDLGASTLGCNDYYNPTGVEFLKYVTYLYNKYVPNGEYPCGDMYHGSVFDSKFVLTLTEAGEVVPFKYLEIDEDGLIIEYSASDIKEDFKSAKIDVFEMQEYLEKEKDFKIEHTRNPRPIGVRDYDFYHLEYFPNDTTKNGAISIISPVGEKMEVLDSHKRVFEFYGQQYIKLMPEGEFTEFFEEVID